VASERGPSGARLVAIDERGDRQFSLIAPPRQIARDTHPAISPDGTWIVFASSRDRLLSETSLWIAKLGVEQAPAKLTNGPSIDAHPTWTTDGSAIIFASTRDGGDFDLYRLAVRDGRSIGEPVQLTSASGHEITPSIATDGTIVYSSVTQIGERDIESHLEKRAPEGTITHLTPGPADSAPAISPDGKLLAFARPAIVDERANVELWLLPHGESEATAVAALPLTDEGGPVWSRDGRFLFATSIMKGEHGVLFSSVIHVDLAEPRRRVRMLVDRAGAVSRLTPAIVARSLDVRALHEDPEYLSELARIMANAIEKRALPEESSGPEGSR
jgi:Tol biopolymer transport system component